MQTKINIIYRGCNLEKPEQPLRYLRPNGFDKRKCFYTLHKTIQNYVENVDKIFIIIDGEKGYLSDYIESLGYEVMWIDFKSNEKSLKYCYDLATTIEDSNNIYFIEDDYWHNENALEIINEGIEMFGLVTGYDHMDRYTRTDDIFYEKESIKLTKNCHWRTAESTTCTWAVSRKIFDFVESIAKHELLEDRNFFRRIFLEKNIRLYTPIPAVSTHMAEGYMSPFFKY